MNISERIDPARMREIADAVQSLIPYERPGQMVMIIQRQARGKLPHLDIDFLDVQMALRRLAEQREILPEKGFLPATRIYKPACYSPIEKYNS